MKKALKIGGVVLALAIVAGLALGAWGYSRLSASLPRLDGEARVVGLSAAVRVERDAIGVPVIRASNRADVARATGFLHAQDRFFQMDLLRRRAAGELADLFGAAALPLDRRARLHRFRARAARVVAAAPQDKQEILTAYADGVNAGLADLGAKPFEYFLLRAEPVGWTTADTVLAILAMFLDLNDEEGRQESRLGVMHDLLPEQMFEFLAPRGTEWDSPILGGPFDTPPVPGPEIFDLRAAPAGTPSATQRMGPLDAAPIGWAIGSNNWAVAARHTASGVPLLANDMHLGLGVPNIWYRASFVWPDGGHERRVTGVTLPGAPAMVAGSNGHVAWGFTNSYGDWSDLVVIEGDPNAGDLYAAPGGPRRFERVVERIAVRGAEPEDLQVVNTIWGPIVDVDHRGHPRAIRWIAHDEQAVNINLLDLERCETTLQAVETANRIGAPPQNFVVAGADGRIAWSIFGMMPRRVGFDGRLPTSWADGTRRWDGWLNPEEYPRVFDPESGRIWTANARVVDGPMLEKLGDSGYDLGARARQIRDGLIGLDAARPADMLAVQLDDRALFLERWQRLLLGLLTDDAVRADPRRREFRDLVRDWGGRAAVDSAGYRLVRSFRVFLAESVLGSLTSACRKADPRFDVMSLPRWEGPLWRLVTEKPPHLLDPKYHTWDEQMLASVDAALDYFLKDGARLSDRTWGQRNTVTVRHPISLAVPFLGRWLDMPAMQLPGDEDMPRAQGASFGASERMVVSPGREEEGIFHMPCGQSGHPLSAHYRDSHAAWARGDPTPFLPGPPASTLTLVPDR
ncbi:MAG TPA: penicillin acylase family protein [Candidatus Polarisedimenticolia bacterium]|nr:penicillin acylase family protein [Candidatus Polarisedimenticolia bacterium]